MNAQNEGTGFLPVTAGTNPLEAAAQIQQERDHLLLLHEALADLERARSLDERLGVFVQAIRRIGFGRVVITLRDSELNATKVVTAGVSDEDALALRTHPAAGAVWKRRFEQLDRFRISNSFYLPGRDPWVVQEFTDVAAHTPDESDPGSWSPRDALLVPLRNSMGAILATLVLDDPADRTRPSLTRVRTVELFAQQVATALEHASLMEIAEQRAARLQQLHQVGGLLARSLDEPTILRDLARQVEAMLPVTRVVVLTMDDATTAWPRVLRQGGREEDDMYVPAALRALAALSASSQRTAREGWSVAVPSIVGPSTVAVIAVESRDGIPLDASDADLLQTMAAQAGAAISNARLYSESQRERRQSEVLSDVARAVGESLRIDHVLQLILRHATALLRTDGATLALLRGDTLEVTAGIGVGKAMMGSRLALFGSMSGRAVRAASSIVTEDVHEDPDSFGPTASATLVRNTIIVPLLGAQGPVGTLTVFNRVAPFTSNDVEVLQRLADQVAVAVVNARLFEEVAEATREWAVAFDSIGSGMVLLDRRGRIQRTNARARALMNDETEESLLGREFHVALFGANAPPQEWLHLAAIVESRVKRGTHADPEHGRVFDITAAPHPLGGAVVTFDDITQYRSLAERHMRVLETTRDAIVITDRDRRIAFANPAAHDLLGRGPELIGFPTAGAVPEDQRETVREREERGFAGEPQTYEGVVLRPDGERRIVAINTAPLAELGNVTGVVASMRDVTDERRARDAVVQSEARYRNLFDSASDAIYTLDVHGVFTSANYATCVLTGRGQDELLGHRVRPLLAREDRELVVDNFEEALKGHAVRYECHLIRPGGERRTVSVTNTPIRRDHAVVGILGVARDVTAERQREAALARSESRYSLLVESATDAIFTVDEETRFTAVNRALEDAVGRSREALVGESFAKLVDLRDLAVAQRLLQEAYAGERSRGAVRYFGTNGEIRNGSVIMSPVVQDDVIVGVLGILRDVTDEQRLTEQLLQQEKLVAIGQLVSGVAHELNNPLAGVMAFAQLLLASPQPLDDEQRHAVETMHREAKRASKIVSNLLTFARQQPAERRATRVNDIVSDTLELRRYALRAADVEVSLSLDESIPETWADPSHLQQVILNLLANAEQALMSSSIPRRVQIGTWCEAGRIFIEVTDNGPGIPHALLDRVFNPFFTTKPVGQGTGLGLSISDGIVREHGGRISIESQVGAGASFTVELPYLKPPIAVPHDREDGPDVPVARYRILFVDDEQAMRAAVSGFLKSIGHVVHVAQSVAVARALLEKTEYDVVLLDLRMPESGGEVLFHELRERDPLHARRVVFVTGDLQNDDAQRFLRAAGRPVIAKPFQLDELAAAVASVAG